MSDTDTSKDYTENEHVSVRINIHFIILALTLATLIYGVTSWCTIKKFRNFKNYVYLNAILANVLTILFYIIDHYIVHNVMFSDPLSYIWFLMTELLFILYFKTVCKHWLVVIIYMCYVDFVGVFHMNFQRKNIKSSLFAWGAPFITTVTFMLVFYFEIIKTGLIFKITALNTLLIVLMPNVIFPLILNFLFYIRVLYLVCRSFNTSAHTANDSRRRLLIASLIFIFGNFIFLSDYVEVLLIGEERKILSILELLVIYSSAIALDVVLVVVRRNRILWYEFYLNKTNVNSRNHEVITMESLK